MRYYLQSDTGAIIIMNESERGEVRVAASEEKGGKGTMRRRLKTLCLHVLVPTFAFVALLVSLLTAFLKNVFQEEFIEDLSEITQHIILEQARKLGFRNATECE